MLPLSMVLLYRCGTAWYCRSWENNLVQYLAALFTGDKGPATLAAHGLHRWALRHMGEEPMVG
jgi:hypothetical protein